MEQKKNNYLNAKSIHIFAYPIRIKAMNKKTNETLEEKLPNLGWKKRAEKYTEEWDCLKSAYATKQYRTKNANKIFEDNDSLCKTYVSDKVSLGVYKFNIVCKEKTYVLNFDEMELHVYQDDFAIVFVKALNMSYADIETIKIINDKGRCMGLPFIPDEKDGFIVCPEKIEISDKTQSYAAINYREIANDMLLNEDVQEKSFNKNFVSKLFNNFETDITGFDLEIGNDYRCFLISMIRNKELSYNMQLNKWQDSMEFEKEWYAILHADENGPSCTSDEMLKQLLDAKSYYRWMGKGTIYGVTEYSFVALVSTDEGVNNIAVTPFYTSYMDMVSLVLAQKNGVMSLMVEVEKTAKEFKGKIIRTGKLTELQKKYAVWKNEILISEYSDQEQGIELYKLMQEQMLVFKEKSYLDEKVQALYEIAVVCNERRLNTFGLIISIISLVISVVALFVGAS